MTTDTRTVALTRAQRALVARLQAGKAAGNPVVIEGDEMATFLTPEVAAVLDGAVPCEERRDPVLYFVEGPSGVFARPGHDVLSAT